MEAVSEIKSAHKDAPRYIKLHPLDNVAIIVNDFGLPAGSVFSDGLRLIDYVPQGHKVALTEIADGEAIRRYGEIIGHALGGISPGAWVEESRILMPSPPALA